MAKIKAEVLAQRYARQGMPLPARLFGHIHTLNRLAAPVAPLANAALRTSPARSLVQRVTGLHPARSLPPFASPTFTAWFARRTSTEQTQIRGQTGRSCCSRTPSRPSTIRKSG